MVTLIVPLLVRLRLAWYALLLRSVDVILFGKTVHQNHPRTPRYCDPSGPVEE